MYKEINSADVVGNSYKVVKTFFCDSPSDVENLPGVDKVAFGSKAICASGEMYFLTSAGSWILKH